MTDVSQNIIGLYQRHAQTWADARGDRLFEQPWLDRFRALLPAYSAVLDIGCGSGRPIARSLIEQGVGLTGIDSAPQMIAMCAALFPGQSWHVADMRTLALEQTFNGILAWDSFFHLNHNDQRAMFPIFHRHAAPGAALMFTSGPAYGTAVGSFAGEALFHASLDPVEYRDLLAASDFDVIAHAVDDPDCGGHTIWLARHR